MRKKRSRSGRAKKSSSRSRPIADAIIRATKKHEKTLRRLADVGAMNRRARLVVVVVVARSWRRGDYIAEALVSGEIRVTARH